MKKKIALSAGMILFVVAGVAGMTGAFFNDTETSTGNTFTAGAIDLRVDSEQHYNHMVCVQGDNGGFVWAPEPGYTPVLGQYPVPGSPCTNDGNWALTDLTNGVQKFFNFTDVKPGDEGENTISLHIDSNPAWACVDVQLTKNDDTNVTEPEDAELLELDATSTDPDGDLFDGELAQNINFAAWLDQGAALGWQGKCAVGQTTECDPGEGDNKWQGAQVEPLLFSNQSGPASDVLNGKSYPLAMPGLNGSAPMTPNVTNYIGLQWCAGTQTIVGNSITCDGSTLGNIVQTDMMEASVAFRVEQARNNPNFRCVLPVAPN